MDIEYFSTLDPDKPTGGFRSFASFLGELVLVTDYRCPSEEVANAMLARLVTSSESLDESTAFECRGSELTESGGLRSVILFPEGGLLSSLLHSDVNLGWYFRIKIAVNICRALLNLHDLNRIHNDLRPSTLGLDCEWQCKFLELVCVETVNDMYSPHGLSVGIRGDIRYAAPEVLRDSACTGASDMYSFGLVLFELCARVPVHAVPRDAETQNVPTEELLELLPETTPSSLVELIRQLINNEAEYRPGVEDALDWLESLLMETSPQHDPGDPPLPPLPFMQKRISSRRMGSTLGGHSRSLSGGSASGKTLAISPKNAQKLRDIADVQKSKSQGRSSGRRQDTSEICRIDEDEENERDKSPEPEQVFAQNPPVRRASATGACTAV
jgi:serine/threonine protein kinase